MGWYSRCIDGATEDKLWRAKDTNVPEFWDDIFNNPKFDEACAKRFKLSAAALGEEPDNVEEAFEDDVDYDLD